MVKGVAFEFGPELRQGRRKVAKPVVAKRNHVVVGGPVASFVAEIGEELAGQPMPRDFLGAPPPKLTQHVAVGNVSRVIGNAQEVHPVDFDCQAIGVVNRAVNEGSAERQVGMAMQVPADQMVGLAGQFGRGEWLGDLEGRRNGCRRFDIRQRRARRLARRMINQGQGHASGLWVLAAIGPAGGPDGGQSGLVRRPR